MYDTLSVAPRLGAAVDLTGKGTSVLRGFYGLLYDGAVFQSWSRALPGVEDYVFYDAIPKSGATCTIENAATCWNIGAEYDRISMASVYTVSDKLKHPRTDEINIAFEQQLLKEYKFTATYIWRDSKNFIDSTRVGATWTPVQYTVPVDSTVQGGPGGETLTLYRWANRTSTPQFLIQNVDDFNFMSPTGAVLGNTNAYRDYRGLMFVLSRALKNRWQAQLSYVYSTTKGNVNNDGAEGAGLSTTFENPNYALVNSEGDLGFDRTHEMKLFLGYQIPKVEVGLNAYLHAWSGRPWQGYATVSRSVVNMPSNINPWVEPRGTNRNEVETLVDLRAEKVFPVGFYSDRALSRRQQPVQFGRRDDQPGEVPEHQHWREHGAVRRPDGPRGWPPADVWRAVLVLGD